MKRKIILLFALSLILTASTGFAQQNFPGTWKLAETNNWTNELNIKSMTIIVTETDKDLIIERNTQKPDIGFSSKNIYKTSGAAEKPVSFRKIGFYKTVKIIQGSFI